MKLLLDNNLSYKLVERLADVYPGSSHVALLNLNTASDHRVWDVAKAEGYCLVSKDADFNYLLADRGFPPKVIWLRLGNCTTSQVAEALRQHHDAISAFGADERAGLLELHGD